MGAAAALEGTSPKGPGLLGKARAATGQVIVSICNPQSSQ